MAALLFHLVCLEVVLPDAGALLAVLLYVPDTVLQELLAERARLQVEVEALRASTAAEVNSSKADLAAQRTALLDKEAVLGDRDKELAAGGRGSHCSLILSAAAEMFVVLSPPPR